MTSWQSFETAVEICSVFFAVLVLGIVIVCARFDDRAKSPLGLIRPFARLVINSVMVLVALVIMSIVCLIIFPGSAHADAPSTLSESIVSDIFMVVLWPVALVSEITPIDSGVLSFILLLFTGLFWGLVIEGIFYLRVRRNRKNQEGAN